jgi:hypothetical protein
MIDLTRKDVLKGLSMIDLSPEQRTYHLQRMKEQYNGYRFVPTQQEPIYNSQYVFYYLRNLYRKGEAPENLIDSAGAVSNSHETVAEYLITNHKTSSNFTLHNLAIGEILPHEMEHFSKKLMQADRIKDLFQTETVEACLISLAYYHGFLTYKTDEDGHTFLSSPNLIMKTIVMNTSYAKLSAEVRVELLTMIGIVNAVGIKSFLVNCATSMSSQLGKNGVDEITKNIFKMFGPTYDRFTYTNGCIYKMLQIATKISDFFLE